MNKLYTVTSTVGPSHQLNLDDVLRTKYTLQSLGYYTPRPHGMTKYPERELFDAIKRFQADNGLYADGIIRPGGQSERVLQAHAATATPTQPDRSAPIRRPSGKPLQQVPTEGGARTPLPRPEQSALSKKKKKTGTYIWRTRGDGKVRSSHAERDGKVFSWASPPEGGHPGKDYGCRCWAEDVDDCELIYEEMEAAYRRHDALHTPILNAERDVSTTEDLLEDWRAERARIEAELISMPIPDRLGRLTKGGALGLAASAFELARKRKELQNEKERLDYNIEINERALAQQKAALQQIEAERNQHASTAAEHSRRYQDCTKGR